MQTRKRNAGLWFSIFAIFLWFVAGSIARAQSADHIMGLWHFDQVNTDTLTTTPDSSGHNNTGTLNGTVGLVSGKWEHVLGFDGTTGYVDIPRVNTSLDLTGSLTLEGWIYLTATDCGSRTFYQTVVGKWGLGGRQAYWLGLYTDCTLRGEISPDGSTTDYAEGGTVVSTNRWHHVAMVYDSSSKTIRVYLDGVDDTASMHGSPSSVHNVTDRDVAIGAWNFPVGPARGLFTGSIDEVRIWNRALTPEEILSSAQAGLRALYHFDEANSTTPDSSGYGNTATLENGAEVVPGPSSPDLGTSFGKALSLNGIDEYAEIQHNSTLDMTGAYTIDAWVDLLADTPLETYQPILFRATTNDNEIEIYVQKATDALIVAHNRGDGGVFDFATCSRPPFGSWFHLGVTYDGTTINAYYNGTRTTCTLHTSPMPEPLATGLGWWIGKVDHTAFGGANYFNGYIDEVHIWGRALGENEIKLLAGKFVSPVTTDVVPAAPLFIPDIWKEEFGTGAVYGSDWHVGTTNPATVLQLVVPDDEGITISDVMQTAHPPSDATLDGFVLGNSDLDALITGEQGATDKTLHLSTTLSDGVVLKSVWNPGY